jgi:acetylglutamate kinase
VLKIAKKFLYRSKFQDSIFVLKISGHLVTKKEILENILKDIKALMVTGIRVIIVYGGGAPMDAAADAIKHTPRKIDGRRITTETDLKLAKQVMVGDLSFRILASLQDAGLRGLCMNALPAHFADVVLRPKEPVDFGFVGDIRAIHAKRIKQLLLTDAVLFFPALAVTEGGELVNINADTIATELAIALQVAKLVFFTDVNGVIENKKLLSVVTVDMIERLVQEGIAVGGMGVKLRNAKEAIERGVSRVHILNGLQAGVLQDEVITSKGCGTMVVSNEEFSTYQDEVHLISK